MKKQILVVLVTLALLPLASCQSFESSITSSEFAYEIDEITNAKSSVFYEIFVGSFYDSNADGMGDFNGVSQKLDYLGDMGVGGVWFMPIHPSPTYHKYDVTDYYGIAPQYGTMADFESYLDAAESHNIDTIIDLVVNHTSNYHPWFIEAVNLYKNDNCAAEDSVCHYYNFSDSVKSGYSRIDDFFYEARFWSGMPDLNLDNPYVREEIRAICEFWLNKGVNGFRLDAVTSYYTNSNTRNIEFLSWLNSAIKQLNPQAYIVAEGPWGTTSSEVIPYYESQIDSFFNFPVSVTGNRIYTNIRQATGKSFATFMSSYNQGIKEQNETGLDAPFLSNHDQGRSAGLMYPENRDFSRKLMGSIYLLMPGRPFIYYGEEIEMRGSGIDENKRLPMIWSKTDKIGQTNLPIGANYDMDLQVQLGALDQRAIATSLLNHYRKVISVRNKYNDYIEHATITPIGTNDALYGLTYETESGSLHILTNFSAESITETLLGTFSYADEIPTSQIAAEVTITSGQAVVTIPPFATVILLS
ncbi:MAG TPA: alpha-amlyase [Firmicutes bacterium]|nr:alpha-amlyase [Bacillota bacterium]